MSAIPFWSRDDRFYRHIGINSVTIGLLGCDGYIGDIVIPCIGVLFHIHFTVTLAGLKNVNRYIGNLSYRRSLHRGSTVVYEVRKEDLHT